MSKVLVYTQSLDPATVEESIDAEKVASVSSFLKLAESIVEEKSLLCVLVQIDGVDSECRAFLESLKRHFPILDVGVITEDRQARLPEGYTRLGVRVEQDAFGEEIRGFLSSLAVRNKRQYARYDWPLKGLLSLDGKSWTEYHLRSVSAGGAFLECERDFPEPGKRAIIKVVFQNSKLVTRCEILDARQASSNMPWGFGVRFTDLSVASRMIIDEIVQDALVHSLVNPDEEPEVPSLAEEVLTPDFESA